MIFDLDGTLIDSLTDLALATNYALRTSGFPEHPVQNYRQFVGNGIVKLLERALPEKQRTTAIIEQVKVHFLQYYSTHLNDYTTPYPDIVELLNELTGDGINIAVATNKPEPAAQAIVAEKFKDIRFAAVLGQTPDRPIKPNPVIVYHILKTTGCFPAQTLYVGDSGVDMQTASYAHIAGIGCLWGFRDAVELMNNGATHLVAHPSEVLKFCK